MSTTITKIKSRTKLRKKRVSIRLNPDIHQQAEQLAKADKRSFSQFVEFVLEQYVQKQQTQEQQELAKYFKPGDVHGLWSQYGAFEAAEQLQALLKHSEYGQRTD